ncbi:DUF4845 domain-containing protein [Thiorhodospira sibirica]|uniref:DUF4845 domain-containing protein n=1 Tax=Thiorhodospira sibirica TaxID=154347 RepID=UPI00022C0B78|nr:DUF4845 domain-containing protein [Thiorhodospira sibirica]
MYPKQRGGSLAVTLLLVGVLGFSFITAFRLFPIYAEYFTIKSVLSDIAEKPGGKTKTTRQIWSEAAPSFQVNSVDSITVDNLSVFDEQGVRYLGLAYEVRTGFVGNLDLMVVFERRFELN